MAEIEDLPQHRVRNQSYQRAKDVLDALRSMRNGGTAFDVRDKVIDATGCKVTIGPVKSALWHLHDLGHVTWIEESNARWWKAVDGSASHG